MSEQEHRRPSEFSLRLNELKSKMKLASNRVDQTTDSLIDLDLLRVENDRVLDLANAKLYAAKVLADCRWILSLRKTGIPEDAVLRAWNLKEEYERNPPPE